MDKTLNNYLKSHKGTAFKLQIILNYHYDQIIREIKQEIPAEDQSQIMDSLLDYLYNKSLISLLSFPAPLDNFIDDLSK